MRIADTHCHLDFPRFDKDRETVIEEAKNIGVERILIPAIDIPTSKAAIRLAEKYDLIYAAVGVQPNSGLTWNSGSYDVIETLSSHPKVVAIGEIGLDYYWDKCPKEIQREIFIEQLKLAEDAELPVIIHSRDSVEDTIDILIDWQKELTQRGSKLAENPGVMHSYSGNSKQAQRLEESNFCVGITGPVTFKKADGLRDVVRNVSIENIFIETDAPYLTPEPHRGKRNKPSYTRYIVEKISEVKDLPIDKVGEITTKNSYRVFGWKTRD
jgi:TatD DNase family protein